MNPKQINKSEYIHFGQQSENVPKFLAKVTESSDVHIDLNVWEVVGWDKNLELLIDEEIYCIAYIKWDGCSNIEFPEGVHLCGKSSYEEHCKLLMSLFDFASKTIKNFDHEVAK